MTEVAEALEISKSGAHSQLSALAEIGFLKRTRDNRYQLGWRLVSLSQTLLRGTGLRAENRRVLQALARRAGTGCSAQLMVLDGLEVFCIARATNEDRRPAWGDSDRLPSTTTACGKLLLATQPLEQMERALVTVGGPSIPEEPEAGSRRMLEFERIRQDGAAWDHSETFDGVTCVAGPVRDSSGTTIAAVSLSGPSERFAREGLTWERLVRDAGRILLPRPTPVEVPAVGMPAIDGGLVAEHEAVAQGAV